MLERDLCIRVRCLYLREVDIRQMSVIERDLCIRGRCLYWRDVCIREYKTTVTPKINILNLI